MKRTQLIFFLLSGIIFFSFASSKKTGLKSAQKTLNNFCSFVPSGLSIVDGDTLSVQSFYMSSTEITNFEYNEFLSDLLKKGEHEKYDIAKIDSTGWTRFSDKMFMKPMADYYHNHPAYDNYPVVNVTKEGAELFCKWLTEKYQVLSEGQLKIAFRIPTRAEWMRAANGDKLNIPYSWGEAFLRNDKGIVRANFLAFGSENIARNSETGDLEVMRTGYSNNHDGADFMAPSKSYYPNALGFYNLNGNVSEMISDGNYAVGGDWYSPGYDIRNESIKKTDGAQPTVGFRVVGTVLGGEIRQR